MLDWTRTAGCSFAGHLRHRCKRDQHSNRLGPLQCWERLSAQKVQPDEHLCSPGQIFGALLSKADTYQLHDKRRERAIGIGLEPLYRSPSCCLMTLFWLWRHSWNIWRIDEDVQFCKHSCLVLLLWIFINNWVYRRLFVAEPPLIEDPGVAGWRQWII